MAALFKWLPRPAPMPAPATIFVPLRGLTPGGPLEKTPPRHPYQDEVTSLQKRSGRPSAAQESEHAGEAEEERAGGFGDGLGKPKTACMILGSGGSIP